LCRDFFRYGSNRDASSILKLLVILVLHPIQKHLPLVLSEGWNRMTPNYKKASVNRGFFIRAAAGRRPEKFILFHD